MDIKEQFEDRIFEKLYESIMKAITESADVRRVLQNLKSLNITREMTTVNLILCIDELMQMAIEKQTKCASESEIGPNRLPDQVDFDEIRWLKQARIKF